MAIKQTISLEGLQQAQEELKKLADVGVSAFERIGQAVEGGGSELSGFVSTLATVGRSLNSLGGAVAGVTALAGAMLTLAVSASNAGEEFENLGHQLGTSADTASALITSFARAGTDIEGLSQGLRRAATNISTEFAQIQKSVGDAGLKLAQNNLNLQQAYIKVGEASRASANQQKNAALQSEANAQSVADAQQRLDDLLRASRDRERGFTDPQEQANLAAARQRQEIAKAELQLRQAQQKAAEEAAEAEAKAQQAALAAAAARLSIAKLEKEADDERKNSVENLVGFVDEISKGITDSGREVERTVDNIFKGIVASAGAAGKAIDTIDFSKAIPPTTFDVLLKTADVLKNLTSETEKSALLSKVLNRQAGPEAVAFFSQGSEAIRGYINEVKSLGLALGEDAVAKTQEFRKSLFTLQSTLSAIKNQIGTEFTGVFGPVFNDFNQSLIDNRKEIVEWARSLGEKAVQTIKDFKEVVNDFNQAVKESDSTLGAFLKLFEKDYIFTIKFNFPPILNQGPEALTTLLLGPPGSPLRRLLLGERAPSTPSERSGLNEINTDEAQRQTKSLDDQIKDLDAAARAAGGAMADSTNKATDGAKKATEAWKSFDNSIKQVTGSFRTIVSEFGRAGPQVFVPETFSGTPTNKFVQGTGLPPGSVSTDRLGVSSSGQQVLQQTQQQAQQAEQVAQQAKAVGEAAAKAVVDAFQNAAEQITAIFNSIKDSLDAIDFSSIISSDEIIAPFLDAEEGIIAVFDAIAQEAARVDFMEAIRRGLVSIEAVRELMRGGIRFATGGSVGDGGRVRGPGTWTSDSIPAMLSRDEYVQPAHRVHQYGVDFMEAIRSGLISTDAVRSLMGDFTGFRYGGLVKMPSFAEGGLVGGATHTLNLVLGGQTFPVQAQANVIDALEREATLRGIAATGIPQSFVGRR